jgi:hypothetical protein
MKSKKRHNLQDNIYSVLKVWIAGFVVYLSIGTQVKLSSDWLSGLSGAQVWVIGIAFFTSIILIFGSTIYIFTKLRTELNRGQLSSEQKTVATFALGSFLGTVLALLLPIFLAGSLVFGFMAVRLASLLRGERLDDVKVYRDIGLVAVLASTAFFILKVMV